MNKISSSEAFSILDKWREDGAVIQFAYPVTQTGEHRYRWVRVSEVISGESAAAVLSVLRDPFPTVRVNLSGAKYEYGDHREFREDERLANLAESQWVCFLSVEVPSGNKMILSELRGKLPVDPND